METVISVKGLRKQFGSFTAVDGLDFDIYQNEIFGLLGPNGAGKTTTINMICGLLPSSSGTISFEGANNQNYKSLIGYCPQENIFYPKLTCLEQMLFIGQMYGISVKDAKNKAIELLALLGLQDKINVHASHLSGGMKRRLNICLALVHNPGILILDEPEAGLDPQSRVLVRDFIRSLSQKSTIILTTHNMDEADRLANRIAIVDHGKLLLLDTPQNLKKTVGEGDVLELVIDQMDEKKINVFNQHISKLSAMVRWSNHSISISHPDIITMIPLIRQSAEISGILVEEIKLRQNTLEDVFIHLTGRNLRQ